jgi:hypothetical protein
MNIIYLYQTYDQYAIPTMERMRTFTYTIIRNYPLEVAIVKHGDWIVTGGDDGFTFTICGWENLCNV